MRSRVFTFESINDKKIFLAIISDRYDLPIYMWLINNAEFIQVDFVYKSVIAIDKKAMRYKPHSVVTEELIAAMQLIQDKDVLSALLCS